MKSYFFIMGRFSSIIFVVTTAIFINLCEGAKEPKLRAVLDYCYNYLKLRKAKLNTCTETLELLLNEKILSENELKHLFSTFKDINRLTLQITNSKERAETFCSTINTEDRNNHCKKKITNLLLTSTITYDELLTVFDNTDWPAVNKKITTCTNQAQEACEIIKTDLQACIPKFLNLLLMGSVEFEALKAVAQRNVQDENILCSINLNILTHVILTTFKNAKEICKFQKWEENACYIKLQTISLVYEIKSELLQKIAQNFSTYQQLEKEVIYSYETAKEWCSTTSFLREEEKCTSRIIENIYNYSLNQDIFNYLSKSVDSMTEFNIRLKESGEIASDWCRSDFENNDVKCERFFQKEYLCNQLSEDTIDWMSSLTKSWSEVQNKINVSEIKSKMWCDNLNSAEDATCIASIKKLLLTDRLNEEILESIHRKPKIKSWKDIPGEIERTWITATEWCLLLTKPDYYCYITFNTLINVEKLTEKSFNYLKNKAKYWRDIRDLVITGTLRVEKWLEILKQENNIVCSRSLLELHLLQLLDKKMIDVCIKKGMKCEDIVKKINATYPEPVKTWCTRLKMDNNPSCMQQLHELVMIDQLNEATFDKFMEDKFTLQDILKNAGQQQQNSQVWCEKLGDGQNQECISTLQKLGSSGQVDNLVIDHYVQNKKMKWPDLKKIEVIIYQQTSEWCVLFNARKNNKCIETLERYALLDQIDENVIKKLVARPATWNLFEDQIKASHENAKNWCIELRSENDIKCIENLQKLELTGQINGSVIEHLRKRRRSWKDVVDEANKTFQQASNWCKPDISIENQRLCRSVLQKLAMTEQLDDDTVNKLTFKPTTWKKIEAECSATKDKAQSWCEVLEANDNIDCILGLQKLALTNQNDDKVVSYLKNDKFKWEKIVEKAGTTLDQAKNWCNKMNADFNSECIEVLQKLGMTDQLDEETGDKLIVIAENWKEIERKAILTEGHAKKWCESFKVTTHKCIRALQKLELTDQINEAVVKHLAAKNKTWERIVLETKLFLDQATNWCLNLKSANEHRCISVLQKLALTEQIVTTSMDWLFKKQLTWKEIEVIAESTLADSNKWCKLFEATGNLECISLLQKLALMIEINESVVIYFVNLKKQWTDLVKAADKVLENAREWCSNLKGNEDIYCISALVILALTNQIDNDVINALVKEDSWQEVKKSAGFNMIEVKEWCKKYKADENPQCIEDFQKLAMSGQIDSQTVEYLILKGVSWKNIKGSAKVNYNLASQWCEEFAVRPHEKKECISQLTILSISDKIISDSVKFLKERKTNLWRNVSYYSFYSTLRTNTFCDLFGKPPGCFEKLQKFSITEQIDNRVVKYFVDRKRTVDELVKAVEKTKEDAKNWCIKMNTAGDYNCISALQYFALNDEIDEKTMNILIGKNFTWNDIFRANVMSYRLATDWCGMFNNLSNLDCIIQLEKLTIIEALTSDIVKFLKAKNLNWDGIVNAANEALKLATTWCKSLNVDNGYRCITGLENLILLDQLDNEVMDVMLKKRETWTNIQEVVKTANENANYWCNTLKTIDITVYSRITDCVLFLEKCSLTDQINDDVVKHFFGKKMLLKDINDAVRRSHKQAEVWCINLNSEGDHYCITTLQKLALLDRLEDEVMTKAKKESKNWNDLAKEVDKINIEVTKWCQVVGAKEMLNCKPELQRLAALNQIDGDTVKYMIEKKLTYQDIISEANTILQKARTWCQYIKDNTSDCILKLMKLALTNQIDDFVMEKMIKKSANLLIIEKNAAASYGQAQQWCDQLEEKYNPYCITILQKLHMTEQVDKTTIKHLIEEKHMTWVAIHIAANVARKQANNWCKLLKMDDDYDCISILQKLAMLDQINNEIAIRLIEKPMTLKEIDKEAAATNVKANNWCIKIKAVDVLTCTLSLQTLALTEQLDENIVDYMKKKNLSWELIYVMASSATTYARSWCIILDTNNDAKCISTLQKLYLLNEINARVILKMMKNHKSWKELESLATTANANAVKWCKLYKVADNLGCIESLQILAVEDKLDGATVEEVIQNNLTWEGTVNSVNENYNKSFSWCTQLAPELTIEDECLTTLEKLAVSFQLTDELIVVMVQKGIKWKEVEKNLIASLDKAKEWCRVHGHLDGKVCIRLTQTLFTTGLIDDITMKNLMKQLTTFKAVKNKIDSMLAEVQKWCVLLNKPHEFECESSLIKLAITDQLETSSIEMVLMRRSTVKQIEKDAGEAEEEATNWCKVLGLPDDIQCIRKLQKLKITDQVDDETIKYLAAKKLKLHNIIDDAEKALTLSKQWCTSLGESMTLQCWTSLEKLLLTNQINQPVIDESFSRLPTYKEIVQEVVVHQEEAKRWCKDLNAEKNVDCIEPLQKHAFTRYVDNSVVYYLKVKGLNWKTILERIDRAHPLILQWCSSLKTPTSRPCISSLMKLYLLDQIDQFVIDKMNLEDATWKVIEKEAASSQEKSNKYCVQLGLKDDSVCQTTLQKLFMTYQLDDNTMNHLLKLKFDYKAIIKISDASRVKADNWCASLKTTETDCKPVLQRLATTGQIDENVINTFLSKKQTWKEIEKAAAVSNTRVKMWCSEVGAEMDFNCTSALEILELTDQLDEKTIRYLIDEKKLGWIKINDEAKKKLDLANNWCLRLGVPDSEKLICRSTLEKLALTDQLIDSLITKYINSGGWKKIEKDCAENWSLAAKWCEMLRLPNNIKCILELQSFALTEQVDDHAMSHVIRKSKILEDCRKDIDKANNEAKDWCKRTKGENNPECISVLQKLIELEHIDTVVLRKWVEEKKADWIAIKDAASVAFAESTKWCTMLNVPADKTEFVSCYLKFINLKMTDQIDNYVVEKFSKSAQPCWTELVKSAEIFRNFAKECCTLLKVGNNPDCISTLQKLGLKNQFSVITLQKYVYKKISWSIIPAEVDKSLKFANKWCPEINDKNDVDCVDEIVQYNVAELIDENVMIYLKAKKKGLDGIRTDLRLAIIQAGNWCSTLGSSEDYDCVTTLEILIITDQIKDNLKQVFKVPTNWKTINEKAKSTLPQAKKWCASLSAVDDTECISSLQNLALSGEINDPIIKHFLENHNTWKDIKDNKKAEMSASDAKSWCAKLQAAGNHDCILALERLALVNQINADIMIRLIAKKIPWPEISKKAEETNIQAKDWCVKLGSDKSPDCISFLQTLLLKEELNMETMNMILVYPTTWKKIEKDTIENKTNATKWCSLLNAADNEDCHSGMLKLALVNLLNEETVKRFSAKQGMTWEKLSQITKEATTKADKWCVELKADKNSLLQCILKLQKRILNDELDDSTMKEIFKKSPSWTDIDNSASASNDQAQNWCNSITTENKKDCVLKLQKFSVSNRIDEDSMKYAIEKLKFLDNIITAIDNALIKATEWCTKLRAGGDFWCASTLSKLVLSNQIDEDIMAKYLQIFKTWQEIVEKVAGFNSSAKQWCAYFDAMDDVDCLSNFRKLGLTDQIDSEVMEYLRFKYVKWRSVNDRAGETLPVVTTWCGTLKNTKPNCIPKLQKILLTDQSEEGTIDELIKQSSSFDDILNKVTAALESAIKWCSSEALQLSKDPVCLRNMQKLAMARQIDDEIANHLLGRRRSLNDIIKLSNSTLLEAIQWCKLNANDIKDCALTLQKRLLTEQVTGPILEKFFANKSWKEIDNSLSKAYKTASNWCSNLNGAADVNCWVTLQRLIVTEQITEDIMKFLIAGMKSGIGSWENAVDSVKQSLKSAQNWAEVLSETNDHCILILQKLKLSKQISKSTMNLMLIKPSYTCTDIENDAVLVHKKAESEWCKSFPRNEVSNCITKLQKLGISGQINDEVVLFITQSKIKLEDLTHKADKALMDAKEWCSGFSAENDFTCITTLERLAILGHVNDSTMKKMIKRRLSWNEVKNDPAPDNRLAKEWCTSLKAFDPKSNVLDLECTPILQRFSEEEKINVNIMEYLLKKYQNWKDIVNSVNETFVKASKWCENLGALDDHLCISALQHLLLTEQLDDEVLTKMVQYRKYWREVRGEAVVDYNLAQKWCTLLKDTALKCRPDLQKLALKDRVDDDIIIYLSEKKTTNDIISTANTSADLINEWCPQLGGKDVSQCFKVLQKLSLLDRIDKNVISKMIAKQKIWQEIETLVSKNLDDVNSWCFLLEKADYHECISPLLKLAITEEIDDYTVRHLFWRQPGLKPEKIIADVSNMRGKAIKWCTTFNSGSDEYCISALMKYGMTEQLNNEIMDHFMSKSDPKKSSSTALQPVGSSSNAQTSSELTSSSISFANELEGISVSRLLDFKKEYILPKPATWKELEKYINLTQDQARKWCIYIAENDIISCVLKLQQLALLDQLDDNLIHLLSEKSSEQPLTLNYIETSVKKALNSAKIWCSKMNAEKDNVCFVTLLKLALLDMIDDPTMNKLFLFSFSLDEIEEKAVMEYVYAIAYCLLLDAPNSTCRNALQKLAMTDEIDEKTIKLCVKLKMSWEKIVELAVDAHKDAEKWCKNMNESKIECITTLEKLAITNQIDGDTISKIQVKPGIYKQIDQAASNLRTCAENWCETLKYSNSECVPTIQKLYYFHSFGDDIGQHCLTNNLSLEDLVKLAKDTWEKVQRWSTELHTPVNEMEDCIPDLQKFGMLDVINDDVIKKLAEKNVSCTELAGDKASRAMTDAASWCTILSSDSELCIQTLQKLALSGSLFKDVVVYCSETNMTWEEVAKKVNSFYPIVTEWCKSFNAEKSDDCKQHFLFLSFLNQVNDDIMKKLPDKPENWNDFINKVDTAFEDGTSWCEELDANSFLNCILKFQELELRGLIDGDTMVYLEKKRKEDYDYEWENIVEDAYENLKKSEQWCKDLQLDSDYRNCLVLEKLGLTDQWDENVAKMYISAKKKIEEITADAAAARKLAEGWCTLLNAEDEEDCIVSLEKLYLMKYIDEETIKTCSGLEITWEIILDKVESSVDKVKQWCTSLKAKDIMNCSADLNKFIILDQINAETMDLLLKVVRSVEELVSIITETYKKAKDWCSSLKASDSVECFNTLQNLSINNKINNDIVITYRQKELPWEAIVDAVKNSYPFAEKWCEKFNAKDNNDCITVLEHLFINGKISSKVIVEVEKTEIINWKEFEIKMIAHYDKASKWCDDLFAFGDPECIAELQEYFVTALIDDAIMKKLTEEHHDVTWMEVEGMIMSAFTKAELKCEALCPVTRCYDCTSPFTRLILADKITDPIFDYCIENKMTWQEIVEETEKNISSSEKWCAQLNSSNSECKHKLHYLAMIDYIDSDIMDSLLKKSVTLKEIENDAEAAHKNATNWCTKLNADDLLRCISAFQKLILMEKIKEPAITYFLGSNTHWEDIVEASTKKFQLALNWCQKLKQSNERECASGLQLLALTEQIDDPTVDELLKLPVKTWKEIEQMCFLTHPSAVNWCESFNAVGDLQCISALQKLALLDRCDSDITNYYTMNGKAWSNILSAAKDAQNLATKHCSKLSNANDMKCISGLYKSIMLGKLDDNTINHLASVKKTWQQIYEDAQNKEDLTKHWCELFDAKNNKDCINTFQQYPIYISLDEQTVKMCAKRKMNWNDIPKDVSNNQNKAKQYCTDLKADETSGQCVPALIKLLITNQLNDTTKKVIENSVSWQELVTNTGAALVKAQKICISLQVFNNYNCESALQNLFILNKIDLPTAEYLAAKLKSWEKIQQSVGETYSKIVDWCKNLKGQNNQQCIYELQMLSLRDQIDADTVKLLITKPTTWNDIVVDSRGAHITAAAWCDSLNLTNDSSNAFSECVLSLQKLSITDRIDARTFNYLRGKEKNWQTIEKSTKDAQVKATDWCKRLRPKDTHDNYQCTAVLGKFILTDQLDDEIFNKLSSKVKSWNELQTQIIITANKAENWCKQLTVKNNNDCNLFLLKVSLTTSITDYAMKKFIKKQVPWSDIMKIYLSSFQKAFNWCTELDSKTESCALDLMELHINEEIDDITIKRSALKEYNWKDIKPKLKKAKEVAKQWCESLQQNKNKTCIKNFAKFSMVDLIKTSTIKYLEEKNVPWDSIISDIKNNYSKVCSWCDNIKGNQYKCVSDIEELILTNQIDEDVVHKIIPSTLKDFNEVVSKARSKAKNFCEYHNAKNDSSCITDLQKVIIKYNVDDDILKQTSASNNWRDTSKQISTASEVAKACCEILKPTDNVSCLKTLQLICINKNPDEQSKLKELVSLGVNNGANLDQIIKLAKDKWKPILFSDIVKNYKIKTTDKLDKLLKSGDGDFWEKIHQSGLNVNNVIELYEEKTNSCNKTHLLLVSEYNTSFSCFKSSEDYEVLKYVLKFACELRKFPLDSHKFQSLIGIIFNGSKKWKPSEFKDLLEGFVNSNTANQNLVSLLSFGSNEIKDLSFLNTVKVNGWDFKSVFNLMNFCNDEQTVDLIVDNKEISSYLTCSTSALEAAKIAVKTPYSPKQLESILNQKVIGKNKLWLVKSFIDYTFNYMRLKSCWKSHEIFLSFYLILFSYTGFTEFKSNVTPVIEIDETDSSNCDDLIKFSTFFQTNLNSLLSMRERILAFKNYEEFVVMAKFFIEINVENIWEKLNRVNSKNLNFTRFMQIANNNRATITVLKEYFKLISLDNKFCDTKTIQAVTAVRSNSLLGEKQSMLLLDALCDSAFESKLSLADFTVMLTDALDTAKKEGFISVAVHLKRNKSGIWTKQCDTKFQMSFAKNIPEPESYNYEGLFSLMDAVCLSNESDPTTVVSSLVTESLNRKIPLQTVYIIYNDRKSKDITVQWIKNFPECNNSSKCNNYFELLGMPIQKLNQINLAIAQLNYMKATPEEVADWIYIMKLNEVEGWGKHLLTQSSSEGYPLNLVIKELMNASPAERSKYFDSNNLKPLKLNVVKEKINDSYKDFANWEQLFSKYTPLIYD